MFREIHCKGLMTIGRVCKTFTPTTLTTTLMVCLGLIAGFSTAQKTWLPVADDYKTYNVENEKKDSKSFYSHYKKLVTLRKESAFASDNFKVVHIDQHVFSYTRGLGDEKYLVAINFGDQMWDKDINDLSGRGVMVFDSEGDKLSMDEVDVNKISLKPGQAVIVNGTSQEWHYS